jgi:hypothetical protein
LLALVADAVTVAIGAGVNARLAAVVTAAQALPVGLAGKRAQALVQSSRIGRKTAAPPDAMPRCGSFARVLIAALLACQPLGDNDGGRAGRPCRGR